MQYDSYLDSFVYRDKLGRPIAADALQILFRDREYRFLHKTEVGSYHICTFWLGFPHPDNTYFETKVSRGNDLLETFWYKTRLEAEEGHKEVVEEYKEKTQSQL